MRESLIFSISVRLRLRLRPLRKTMAEWQKRNKRRRDGRDARLTNSKHNLHFGGGGGGGGNGNGNGGSRIKRVVYFDSSKNTYVVLHTIYE